LNAAQQTRETIQKKKSGPDSEQVSEQDSSPDTEQERDLRADLISSLTGREGDRDRTVAHRTRRVVMSSGGVLKEQKQDRKRARAVALAITLIVLLLMAPLIWEVMDSLVGGEHLGDPGNQLSLWAYFVCPTLLGAALVAGWWRRRG
jgi:hypothetical protein